jgi:hypothetical protein
MNYSSHEVIHKIGSQNTWQIGAPSYHQTSSLIFSGRHPEFMTPLTQYGRMAEKHWREHRPKMVRELERKRLLHQMLLEAEEKTKDEMATLRMGLMQQGKTAQQAHTQAWEMVREKYILLPPES